MGSVLWLRMYHLVMLLPSSIRDFLITSSGAHSHNILMDCHYRQNRAGTARVPSFVYHFFRVFGLILARDPVAIGFLRVSAKTCCSMVR